MRSYQISRFKVVDPHESPRTFEHDRTELTGEVAVELAHEVMLVSPVALAVVDLSSIHRSGPVETSIHRPVEAY